MSVKNRESKSLRFLEACFESMVTPEIELVAKKKCCYFLMLCHTPNNCLGTSEIMDPTNMHLCSCFIEFIK